MLLNSELWAQYRIIAEPSLEIVQVHDDNLFLSAKEPARDVILRVRPALEVRFESPRLSAGGTYGFDSERFADHSGLTNSRARQRGSVSVHYRFDPRLTLALDGGYMDTDTPGELNILTGLAASRVRVQQLNFGPSARYRISPQMSAHVSFSSTTEKLAGGPEMSSKFQTVGIEHKVTPRDSFAADFERGKYLFDLAGARSRTNTYVLRGGWTHALNPTTRVMLQAGPRVTDHSLAPELSASLTHDWQFSSIAILGVQTQTTAIGSIGTVEARSLQARFTYAPTRSLTAYAAPAVMRTVFHDLRATVYRIGLGAHYAITPLAGFDVAYSLDSQHGVFDALHSNGAISRSVLSAGFTARWSAPDRFGTGRR
jgi:hypothetical protein